MNNAEYYAEDLKHYNLSNDICHRFFDWLKRNTKVKIKLTYIVSFLNYVRVSEFGEANIEIEVPKFQSASIRFGHALFHTDKGISFRLWKYNGNHYDNGSPKWVKTIKESEFPELWRQCCEFFGFQFGEPKHETRYVQMSIFDFI